MLRNIKIEGFRGIRSIELDELQIINVLIGENNSGKTSVLEAIQLLAQPEVLAGLYRVAYRREYGNNHMLSKAALSMTDLVLYTLNQREDKELCVEAIDSELGQVRAYIQGKEYCYMSNYQTTDLFQEDGIYYGFRGTYEYDSEVISYRDSFDLKDQARMIRSKNQDVIPMGYLNPQMIHTQNASIKSMYNAMRSEERRELIELLGIFDSRIIGIDRTVRSGRAITFLELENGDLMPVSTFGDGIKKVLAIANVIMKTKGGVVLIDEFETGIHKKALSKVAAWLYQAAKEYNTQIFLTTHSSEALEALLDESFEQGSVNTYRIEQYKGDTFVKKFNGESLEKYRNNGGMDIF